MLDQQAFELLLICCFNWLKNIWDLSEANKTKLWKNLHIEYFWLISLSSINTKQLIKSSCHNHCNILLVPSTLGSSMLCMGKISHFVCGSAINVEEQAPNVPCLGKIKGIFKICVHTCTHMCDCAHVTYTYKPVCVYAIHKRYNADTIVSHKENDNTRTTRSTLRTQRVRIEFSVNLKRYRGRHPAE